MSQKFLPNFLFLLFVNVLVKPVYIFGIDMKVQDVVGAEDYGLYFSLYSFAVIFLIVLDLGLTQYNSRVIAGEHSLLKEYLPNFILTKLILGLVFFFLLFIVALFLGFSPKELYWVGLLGIILFLNSLIEYFRSNIAALHLFKLDAILSIINRGMLIVICGIMLYGTYVTNFKIEDFIYAQVATLTFTSLLSFGLVLKYAKGAIFIFDKGLILKILKEGYPYALLVLLTAIYTRTDAVMLKELLPENGTTEAGYYAAAYRFLDMAAMFGLLMANQLLPMFSKLIKENKKQEVRDLVQTGFKIIMLISIAISVCISIFGVDIIQSIFREEEYPPAYVGLILSLLIFSFIPIASSYVFNTLMNASADLRVLNIIGIIGVILNIILNFILIPRQGALGAVYATIFTQGFASLAHLFFANRILELRLPLSLFLRVIIFGVLMYLLVRYGSTLTSVNWLIQFIVGGILALPLGWMIGLLDIGMLKEIFSRKMKPQA